jgi:ubiquinol-cytochrome c reductase cytochrome c1 subunit
MQLELVEPGRLNPAQYRRAVRDLVNYITYMSEPARLVRYDIGVWVLLFLAGFFVLTRALYKEYWKDVH